jgi:hypothetical protein
MVMRLLRKCTEFTHDALYFMLQSLSAGDRLPGCAGDCGARRDVAHHQRPGAGGPGTHSVYLPGFGDMRSVTRKIE